MSSARFSQKDVGSLDAGSPDPDVDGDGDGDGDGEVEDPEGMTQTRMKASSQDQKMRITVELSQLIYNYFDNSKIPEGRVGSTLIVIPGNSKGRLSNIDDAGRFIHRYIHT
jgi:hypothetical protein